MASPQNFESGIDFSRVDDTRKHPLGIEVPGNDGCTYKYIRAGEALTAKNFLTVDHAEGVDDFEHTDAVSEVIGGIANVAIGDNKFGWIIVHGVVTGANVATGVAAGDKLGSTATAGRADKLDASSTVSQAEARAAIAAAAGVGVEALTAESSNTATVILF